MNIEAKTSSNSSISSSTTTCVTNTLTSITIHLQGFFLSNTRRSTHTHAFIQRHALARMCECKNMFVYIYDYIVWALSLSLKFLFSIFSSGVSSSSSPPLVICAARSVAARSYRFILAFVLNVIARKKYFMSGSIRWKKTETINACRWASTEANAYIHLILFNVCKQRLLLQPFAVLLFKPCVCCTSYTHTNVFVHWLLFLFHLNHKQSFKSTSTTLALAFWRTKFVVDVLCFGISCLAFDIMLRRREKYQF